MEHKAWHCPACNAYHAPHCDTCPARTAAPYYVPQTPVGPYVAPWPGASLPVVVDPMQPPYITTYLGPPAPGAVLSGAVDIRMIPH